jgi:hypothetical protein
MVVENVGTRRASMRLITLFCASIGSPSWLCTIVNTTAAGGRAIWPWPCSLNSSVKSRIFNPSESMPLVER